MTLSVDKPAPQSAAALLNPSLRALAPELVTYQCELKTLIERIEADLSCSLALMRYADKRQNDPERTLETVQQAVVYLGLIETKQFLFAYLLLDQSPADQNRRVQLLVRARLTAELFKTTGPLNKDLAFVGALLSSRSLLRIQKPETLYLLFKLDHDQRQALRNFDFGLRDSIRQAAVIEARCHPKSSKRAPMPAEFESMFEDAFYWANLLAQALASR